MLHTKNTLSTINNQIQYNDHSIEINRDEVLEKIISNPSSIIFLMGRGGCRKTATVKKMYEKLVDSKGVMYLRKAHELLRNSSNRLKSLDLMSS